MIEYRQFVNSDPPHILRLWHECQLGRGAAQGLHCDEFDELVFAQTYFDPAGMILACRDGRVVGFVHAGFGTNEDRSWLSTEEGVVCAVMVHPTVRGQGIGRELVRRAESYLRSRGSKTIFAGPAEPRDSFYCGIYGGSQSAGFLQSDPAAAPFLAKLGYTPCESHLIFQRSLGVGSADPVGARLVNVRRTTRLTALSQEPKSWWWQTRYGRLDAMHLALIPRTGGSPLARISVVGLDRYVNSWQTRGIGLLGLYVTEANRQKGYGQALLVEVCRRVRDDMVQLAEAHAPKTDVAAIAVLESAGFQQIDSGLVYRLQGT
ncbi:MAG: GNAT family N-acetyltransferase [Planctomycetes bacterium]|nr:GNAT family N-acetyltransferase [Planctomycetota bacterium]